ncbi:mucin-17 isoform X4 [Solea solea]|uniref:mucin-17 isoform X4 n=1 Tax=Solea solea TaxID=90069 RepID=UPI00272B8608|nr:mucin-17 isoform X4 [Solea solea]
MQFCRKVLCPPCSARVTSPEDMEYKMGSCIGISHSQAEGHADTLTQRDDRRLLTDASASQQSLLSQPTLADVAVVVSGVEESRGGATGEQEDKEELEFPHDLLPSLDFSSELNIWGASLGAPSCSGAEKREQVNPLLAALHHHVEVSGPLVVPDTRLHDSDPVPTDALPSLQSTATPHLVVRSPSPPSSVLIDWELQEALKECEEQMASLGMLPSVEHASITHEKLRNEGKKTGDVIVKSSESSSLPPIVVQPGHSNGDHGNKDTHGKSEAANSQKDLLVFSFRNYILGTEEDSPGAAETKNEKEAARIPDKCTGIKLEIETEVNEQKQTLPSAQLKTAAKTDSTKEIHNDVLTQQRDSPREEHDDSKAAVEENPSLDCLEMIRDKGTQAITEAAHTEKEKNSDECRIDVCSLQSESKDDSVDIFGGSGIPLSDKDVLFGLQSVAQAGADEHTEENLSKASDRQAAQNKEAKKKDKKRQRKKKKTEKHVETELKEKTAVQSDNDLQAQSFINSGINAESESSVQSMSQADTQTVICGEQPDNGFDYKQQLSPAGKPSPSPPLSSTHGRQDQLTDSSPASTQTLSQWPHQSDNHGRTDAPCGMTHSLDKNTQWRQHATGDVINNQNTPVTHVQTTVIHPLTSADKRSDAQIQEAIVTTTDATIPTQEKWSPLTNSQTCVGERCVASALEEASVGVAALPLTTPTIPEVIESCEKGESVRHNLLASEASVAATERVESVREKDLGGREKCLGSADEQRERLPGSPSQLSLISSEGKCSLAFSTKEGQAASEESCSEMPHNSTEAEIRGTGETNIHSADTDILRAEEGDREKESLRLEAFINTSPLGLLTGSDRQTRSAVGLEGAGEGGGRQAVEEKGGLTREHSSFSQPEGYARGVSSAETETYPPTNVAESQLKSQGWSEPIASITESICTEQDCLSNLCQEQHGAAILPLSTHSEQSSTSASGGIRAESIQNWISEEALPVGHTCEESSAIEKEGNNCHVFPPVVEPQPLTASQHTQVEQQTSSDQQVQPESSTTEARTTKTAVESKSQSNTAMSGVAVNVCGSSAGHHRVHFADNVKEGDNSTVALRNISVGPLDCASLPPLTTHESLYHPVVEASYIFPDFLSLKGSEIPTNKARAGNESATQSSADLPMTQKGDLETKATKDNIAKDQSGNEISATNTVDLQSVSEAYTKQLPCPTQKNQTGNEECFDCLQTTGSSIVKADPVTDGHVLVKEMKIQAESIDVAKPEESPLLSSTTRVLEERDVTQQPASSCSVFIADHDPVSCKPLSHVTTQLPVDTSSEPETVTLTCTTSLQSQPSDATSQLPTQLDHTSPCGLVTSDPTEAGEGSQSTIPSVDLAKGESVTSDVRVADLSIPVIEQSAGKLPPPGPMLSHLEFITDCDIYPLGDTEQGRADSDFTEEVSGGANGNKSKEATQMSVAQDLGPVDVKADETSELQNNAINDVNAPLSQEKERSDVVVGEQANDDTDSVISLSQTESDPVAVKPVFIEAPVGDGVMNIGCTLSSDLPTNKVYDDIKKEEWKTEKPSTGEWTSTQLEENEKQSGEAATDNQTEKAITAQQQINGDVQHQCNHEVENKDAPISDIRVEELKENASAEASSLFPDRPVGLSEDMLNPESVCEPQTDSVQALHQTPAATLVWSSDGDTAPGLSETLGQSPNPNSFAQQQENHQQQQESRHLTEELSGACLVGVEKITCQDRQIQALVPEAAEKRENSVGSLCQSVGKDGLMHDDSRGDGQVEEKGKEKGDRAQEAVQGLSVTSYTGNDVNEEETNAPAEEMTTITCSNISETSIDTNESAELRTVGSDAELIPGAEFLNDVAAKGQRQSNLSAPCQDQREKSETTMNTAVSVESASQERETSPLPISTPSKVNADSPDILAEAIPSANQAEILTKIFSVLPDHVVPPETAENNLNTAVAVKSNSRESEECEILNAVCKSDELQRPIKTPATQSSPGVQTAIKGTDAEALRGEDKTAVDKEKSSTQGSGQSEIKAINNETAEKQGAINQSLSAKDSGSAILEASDHWESGVSHSGTETTVCHSEGSFAFSKEKSLGLEDLDSLSLTTPAQSEKPHDQVSLSKPRDDIVDNTTDSPSHCEGKSHNEVPLCVSPDVQPSVDAEAANVSERPEAAPTAQEPETNWINALKEAASCWEDAEETQRALPSLESPQFAFLTQTEEVAAPLTQKEIPPPEPAAEKTTEPPPRNLLKKPDCLPQPLKKFVESPEPTQSTKEESPKKEEEHPEGLKESKAEPFTSSVKVEEAVELLEPAKSTTELPESTTNEDWEPTLERLEPKKKLINELPKNLVEKSAEIPPEEPFKDLAEEPAVTEAVQDPDEELQNSWPPLTEQASEHHLPPTLPSHLHDSVEFPTPPPTPPERLTPESPPTPPASPLFPPPPPPVLASPPAPSAHQWEDPCSASAPRLPALRSSDSDGAFETPESTTPVKAVSITDPQIQQLISDDKGAVREDTSVSDPASDLTDDPLTSIKFDENKPIAASGAYNIELFATDSANHTLTRSLSLQGGELDTSALLDGCTAGGFRPHSESFSLGTESTPGTLHRPKKVRSGSLKKKPLLRQNSNPESPQTASSSSPPELKKPLQDQEGAKGGSATPSPGGTLRRTRKSRVETPPPLLEETSHTSQEESLVISALPLCQEETPLPACATDTDEFPIPPSASYKWDPDNFDKIDPFKTGGSKIANSPTLDRKGTVCASITTCAESSPVPAVDPRRPSPPASPPHEPIADLEEQPILPKRQSVRLEFDYSEESSEAVPQASPTPKKVVKKPGAKMPLRKPKLGLKKAPPAQTEQLDNSSPMTHNGNEDEILAPKASYNFEPDKWEDPHFNPFSSKKGITNSPELSRQSYTFDPSNVDDSIDPFKSSNQMGNSPPKASASFEISSNDYENENDNDNVGELEDQNQNKPAKKKKTPIKSNTFRVKRSPKKSLLSDKSQEDHATDEEKLASSTNHKWASLHDMKADLDSDQQDFPQPSDLTSFINESNLPHQTLEQDYEIEYMEKIGSSSPPLSVKKPSLYLKLDSVSDKLTNNVAAHGSPSSPCTGSFEEMEARITAGMKTPVLSSRPGPEGSARDKGRKRECGTLSRTQSTEADEQSSGQGPMEASAPGLALPLLDRLTECDDPLQYLEPDLAVTNPTAFAQKLQEELVLAALRIEALQVAKNISQCPSLFTVTPQQHLDALSPVESAVYKNSTTSYNDGESPHLPRHLDHSLGIAREEIVMKEKEVLEWKKKYEDSQRELMEMRRMFAEYEKTIAQLIEEDQKDKSLSHHTIQQLIMEKDQALADLNSVEKSMSDLFRRYEKLKDAVDGFRKNEDILKKSAQEYLSRVRKEEQRYHVLKIHAEEKLEKASTDIIQMQTRAMQEQAAYQASLRKEQVKVDSLERTLEQKNKEIEELTKICDELIAKMGKS